MSLPVKGPTDTELEPLRDGWFRLIGMPIVSLMATVTFSASIWMGKPGYFWRVYFSSLITAVLAWEACRWILLRVRRRYPGYRQTVKRALLSFSGYVVVNFFITSLIFMGYLATDYWGYPIGFPSWLRGYMTTMTFTCLLAGLYEAAYFFQQWQRQQREAEELKRYALECQLGVLRSQLSPHFLFNSLNVLSALVEEDFERADRYVGELKRVYQYVLDATGRPLVTVGEELAGLEAYFFLLKTRFGPHLQLEMDLPPERLALRLPPLTLQMLLENAVKHNIVSASKPLWVHISSPTPELLVVTNNLQPKTQLVRSANVGLNNIRQRYAMLGRQLPEMQKTSATFLVQAPLLN